MQRAEVVQRDGCCRLWGGDLSDRAAAINLKRPCSLLRTECSNERGVLCGDSPQYFVDPS